MRRKGTSFDATLINSILLEEKIKESKNMEERDWLVAGVAILFVLLLFGGGGMMGFGMGFMMIFWVILLIAIVYVILNLGKSPTTSNEESALEVLKQRYAKGDIDKKEFEEKKRGLQ
jgi:putative membrane protein